MIDLPAAWASFDPYLVLAGAAVGVLATWVDRRGDPSAPVRELEVARPEPNRVSAPWEPALRAAGAGARRAAAHPLATAGLAAAGFGLAIGRQPFVVFLGLFMIPTLVLGYGALRGRGAVATFVAYAGSDVVLALALMHHQAGSGAWSTPLPGHIGAGATLVCLSAVLRLAGFTAEPSTSRSQAAVSGIGWWQGLFLAWWAGPSAAGLLAAAALPLWAMGAVAGRKRRSEAGVFLAGGLAALLAAMGAGSLTVTAVGLAGWSFLLGERGFSVATLSLAPLTAAVTAGVLPPLQPWLPSALAAAVVLWAAALHFLVAVPDRPSLGGRLAAGAGGAGTAVLILRQGSPMLVWAVYGIGLVLVLVWVAAPQHAASPRRPAPDVIEEPEAVTTAKEAALATLGAVLLAAALIVLVGLTIAGIRTSFL